MPETPGSMLERLCASSDATLWAQLESLYSPLIAHWLSQLGLGAEDAQDLRQQIFMVVVRELPRFRRGERKGSFRCWLRTIAVNRVRAFRRSEKARCRKSSRQALGEIEGRLCDHAAELSRLWDAQHDQYVLWALLARARRDFDPKTWEAFERVALKGEKAKDVAADLGMTVSAVWAAKSRVLKRLRELAQGLMD